jgi:hypothetical protein
MKRFAVAVACLAVAVLVTPSAGAAGGRAPWSGLLAHIPDQAVYRDSVILNDYDAARAAIGAPDPSGSSRERTTQLNGLVLEAGLAPNQLFVTAREPDIVEELGFRPSAIGRDAAAGIGPKALTILQGDGVDREEIQGAAEADSVWSEELTVKTHAGTDYLSWGGEDIDPKRITPVRRLGQGGRLAIDPPFLTWTTRTAPMKASLEAAAGDKPSLADDRIFQALDAEITDLGAFATFMHEGAIELENDERADADVGPAALLPYEAIATGAGWDDDQPVAYVVLLHDDESDAADNCERLRTGLETGRSVTGSPWSELATNATVDCEGTVVTATFTPSSPRLWYSAVLQREPLLAASERRG